MDTEKIAGRLVQALTLTDKDREVLKFFTEGKPGESGKLSTDGKTLDGNWLGGTELATRKSDGTITPGKSRPQVKTDEIVLRMLKTMVPSRFYQGSIAERIARRMVAGVVDDIVAKFPTKNQHWQVTQDGKGFSAFVSDFPGGHWVDPWNRKIPQHMVKAIRDRENEITEWEASTTVEGKRVFLTIWND